MTQLARQQKSAFAEGLARLFRATGLSRKEISAELGVTESAVSLWLNDHVLPRPETLQRILSLARSNAPPGEVERFLELASRRAIEISPRFKGSMGSVGTYLLRPKEDAALAALRQLPVVRQEAILATLERNCVEERETREGPRRREERMNPPSRGIRTKSDSVDRVIRVLVRAWSGPDGPAETQEEIHKIADGMVRKYENGANTPQRLISCTPGLELKIKSPVRTFKAAWPEIWAAKEPIRRSTVDSQTNHPDGLEP